jgi:hypothetical protein
MSDIWFKVLSSINKWNAIIQAGGISLKVGMNLMENLTKELQNIRYEWPQLMAEAYSVAEDEHSSHFPNTAKKFGKKKNVS